MLLLELPWRPTNRVAWEQTQGKSLGSNQERTNRGQTAARFTHRRSGVEGHAQLDVGLRVESTGLQSRPGMAEESVSKPDCVFC